MLLKRTEIPQNGTETRQTCQEGARLHEGQGRSTRADAKGEARRASETWARSMARRFIASAATF